MGTIGTRAMSLFSLADLEAAVPLVRTIVPPTPQHAWPLLAKRTGAEVWVKHENHTPIGAFKVRGGIVYLDALKRRIRQAQRRRDGNARQPWPIDRPGRRTGRLAMRHFRAARQLPREERGDASLWRRADRSRRRFR